MIGFVRKAVPTLTRLRNSAVFLGVCTVAVLTVTVSSTQSKSEVSFTIPEQDRNLDFSRFRHNSERHAGLPCTNCHQRAGDNSIRPVLPGHKACTDCHLAQFVTPVTAMCGICHANLNGSNPPVKAFPGSFNEKFNVRFDHAQHLTGNARPQSGCLACHNRGAARGAGMSIPAGMSAHSQCYSCHTPASKSAAGREIASCGVCHEPKAFVRTSTNARAFRYGFSHQRHGPRERLDCIDCHKATAGLAQGRQVSSPVVAEHFPAQRGQSCSTCHNGKRSFGGDLAFDSCKRCHTGATFRMRG